MKIFALVFTLLSPWVSSAQMFSSSEVQAHKARIDIITGTAAKCLETTYQDHVDFFRRWGVSRYYGDRKPEYQTVEGRRAALARYGAPVSLVSELEGISCIGLTLRCLGEGFAAAEMQTTWNKIYAKLAEGRKFYGTDLQSMLRELGWKVLYWNPNLSKNEAWDAEDKALNPLKPGQTWNPVWGGHAYRYLMVQRKGEYYGVRVDDATSLVNFGDRVPEALKRYPFFVGTAHAGYHVFPGFNAKVIEAHSMRNLNAFDNLEVSWFNPLGTGGGPRWTRTEKYRSGLIAVPPSR